MSAERYYPIPGAVDGGDWDIKDADAVGPQVTLNKRGPGGVMFVPLDESERSRYVRYHEMGHVKWSPKQIKNKPEELEDWVIGACEDARINALLEESAPPPMETRGFTEWEAMYNLKRGFEAEDDLFLSALAASKFATQDTGLLNDVARMMTTGNDEEPANDVMKESWARWNRVSNMTYQVVNSMMYQMDSELQNFTKTTIETAKVLTKLFGPNPKDDEHEGEEEWDQEGFEQMFEDFLEALEGEGYEEVEGHAVWGKMQIFTPKMPRMLSSKLRAPRKRSSDIGVNPVRMDRWMTDKAIFNRKVRAPGGTVLIDASGSMSWSHEQLVQVINTMPAGTVALYSGAVQTESGEDLMDGGLPVGGLRIVARDGRYVGDDYDWHRTPDGRFIDMGNLIDGPALEWLGQQEGPRIWVSDAGVFGCIPDQGYHAASRGKKGELSLHAMELVRKHRISRLDNLREVTEYMARRQKRNRYAA